MSDPGLGRVDRGRKSGVGIDDEVDHHQNPSDFPACGLLRMEAKLWLWGLLLLLLASEVDLVKNGVLLLVLGLVSNLPEEREG